MDTEKYIEIMRRVEEVRGKAFEIDNPELQNDMYWCLSTIVKLAQELDENKLVR